MGVFLVDGEVAGLAVGHAHHAEESGVVGSDGVGAASAHWNPAGAGYAVLRCGPHLLHGRGEGDGESDRADGVNFEVEQGARVFDCFVGRGGRDEHVLADGDAGEGVGEDCVAGLDLDLSGAGIEFERDGVAVELRAEVHAGKDFDG